MFHGSGGDHLQSTTSVDDVYAVAAHLVHVLLHLKIDAGGAQVRAGRRHLGDVVLPRTRHFRTSRRSGGYIAQIR